MIRVREERVAFGRGSVLLAPPISTSFQEVDEHAQDIRPPAKRLIDRSMDHPSQRISRALRRIKSTASLFRRPKRSAAPPPPDFELDTSADFEFGLDPYTEYGIGLDHYIEGGGDSPLAPPAAFAHLNNVTATANDPNADRIAFRSHDQPYAHAHEHAPSYTYAYAHNYVHTYAPAHAVSYDDLPLRPSTPSPYSILPVDPFASSLSLSAQAQEDQDTALAAQLAAQIAATSAARSSAARMQARSQPALGTGAHPTARAFLSPYSHAPRRASGVSTLSSLSSSSTARTVSSSAASAVSAASASAISVATTACASTTDVRSVKSMTARLPRVSWARSPIKIRIRRKPVPALPVDAHAHANADADGEVVGRRALDWERS
jgi:hypothetical protein